MLNDRCRFKFEESSPESEGAWALVSGLRGVFMGVLRVVDNARDIVDVEMVSLFSGCGC